MGRTPVVACGAYDVSGLEHLDPAIATGAHRGLGVHLSFVRSVTMDAWTPDQLARMQAGGNGALNAFLGEYGVPAGATIAAKYNSKAAEIYRDVVKAKAEGRAYTPPPPAEVKAAAAAPAARAAPGAARARPMPHSASFSGPGRTSSWDEWGNDGDGSTVPHSRSSGDGSTRAEPLFGRAAQLEELSTDLSGAARRLTLTGPGGVG